MAGRPSLRAQVSAQRFVLRRLEYSILGRAMPSRHDPLRAQKLALLAGCAAAAGMLVLDVILGSARHDKIPDDALVMVRQSGALFVRVDGRLRPVADLTSARLILGSPATPRLVDAAALARVVDGPVLGIPGAPRSLGTVTAPVDVRWDVCDEADGTTTVSVGDDAAPAELDPNAAVLVTAAHGDGAVYLLYDGKRAMIDPGDPATARALHLDGVVARKVSATVLNVVPEVPAINPPRVAGLAERSGTGGLPVGTVVRVSRADSPEYYVVLRGGLQRVGRLTVDLIRFANPATSTEIPEVPLELVARSPLIDALPVGTYPDDTPSLLDVGEELCATWLSGRSGIAVGRPTGDRIEAVVLAGADGDGPGVDKARMSPGRSLDVVDPSAATRYLIGAAGVRFPVKDSAATALGLDGEPAAAPWAILSALPSGPELTREAALVRRDVFVSAP
ncbi:type VII secretion protein EccB [Mycobacterium sp. CVI_P3]|uniref:Type VII secretion protein EccB n=1 Tax=Mycobacterium pinniadriaticum TaxID=2994102 RepID=A0ABT3SE76_9MYCO|nr:type VII secretion protein EccB [Mycobacterium pinniadriaticum]MCX2931084.1 type VII secretion protein EccB [Mycobacterium pinniadriaticum]MCX2937692.1 type VII secretion protein EccB [Mycobacterium pinniadriaticum]